MRQVSITGLVAPAAAPHLQTLAARDQHLAALRDALSSSTSQAEASARELATAQASLAEAQAHAQQQQAALEAKVCTCNDALACAEGAGQRFSRAGIEHG
jgi:hypothetical protein